MKHLIRAGGLLAVFIIAFVVLRTISPPAVLEGYGFLRARENVEEWVEQPLHYADPATCNDCHQDKHSAWVTSKHSTVSCENCHGPAQAHVESGAQVTLDSSRELCGLCHARLFSRPSDFPQVDIEEHGGGAECITCHNPHNPRVQAPPQVPHTLEGRAQCSVCHGPGGFKPFPEGHAGRSDDTCLSCHRGA